jgi:hypothetical protein
MVTRTVPLGMDFGRNKEVRAHNQAMFNATLGRQTDASHIGCQLLYAVGDGPFRFERRKGLVDPREVDPIVALVRSCTGSEGHRRIQRRRHLLRDVSDLHDVFVASDVERAVVHRFTWRLKNRQESTRDVLGVDERPPRRTVTLEPHLATAGRYVGIAGLVTDEWELVDVDGTLACPWPGCLVPTPPK